MLAMRMVLLYSIALITFFTALDARERITSFASDIVVNFDGTMSVSETIEVLSEGDAIVYGIVREFPTYYRASRGINYNYSVPFIVKAIGHNGKSSPFRVEEAFNGKRVYIGSGDSKINPGMHTYTIAYETNRQIGFFKDHDELYWNVTGNGWRLPIDKATARVQLPEGVPMHATTAEGYTGPQGAQDQHYTSTIEHNTIIFSTTQALRPHEGLTIVVTFPKGFVTAPSLFQKVQWFFQDNKIYLFVGSCLVFLLGLLIAGFIIARRKNKPGTVIPLFYPPKDMPPSAVGTMEHMTFDNKLLSADIVDLAVRGFITIAYDQGAFLSGGTYTLTLNDQKDAGALEKKSSAYDKELLAALFKQDKSIIISNKNNANVAAALKKCKAYNREHLKPYVTELTMLTYSSYAFLLFLGIYVFMAHAFIVLWALASAAYVALLQKVCRVYTPEGRTLQDDIEGFKLYLTTAELNRMKIIGSPPTKTPELYETYLPYAMALGVEQQWTAQFATLFAQLAQGGHPYIPLWYGGKEFRANQFGSQLSSSFSQAIASSATPPGSTSGARGSGRSGGGGGGGGGGGW